MQSLLCQTTPKGHQLQEKKMRTFQSTQIEEINQGMINQFNYIILT